MDAEELVLCVVCRGPWHPASGMMVGSPSRFPMCSRCWRESLVVFRWAVCRKGKGRWRHSNFYPIIPEAPTF
jgi:hypothetical protein